MARCRLTALVALTALTVLCPAVQAEVHLAALFSDGMVLQQGRAVRVWGTADAGEKVTVSVAGAKGEATADAQGKWSVEIGPLSAGGPHEMTVAGSNTLTVKDVMVGEVWVCSGQSNMAMPIDWGVFGAWDSPECQKALAEVDLPKIRMFMVDRKTVGEPADDVSGSWKICRNREILKWSAVGYFFGRQLHEKLDVPIGLIRTAVGGTPVESWMSSDALVATQPDAKAKLAQWAKQEAAFSEAAYQKEVAAWQDAAAKAKAAGQKEPRKPGRVIDNPWRPCSLYNGMVRPLMPYGIRGVIWYQGESNAGKAAEYHDLFSSMIRSWRKEWGQDEFPFLFVQLANFRARKDQPSESQWAALREAQRQTLTVPNTAMAVAIDIGEANDIHPKNKQDVGKRLALGALALAYGQKIVYSGPAIAAAKADGGKVVLSFDSVGGGLVAKGGEALKGFAVAGDDGKYVWAKAEITGDKVVVSSDEVAKPATVRYAWADNPECNLYNAEGLPASPFQVEVGK